ncbi:unnamed protein product [Leptidea sinapis]|uniref:Endonuclease/exonuclease/phosphatase domain-containing protein n=1 Tax=Leptidea sinapis TaxID=189913 RepID=A0A5E4QAL7_9NEOP|nr:unnamed protein product [Leptidea sinapis]
MKRGCPSPTEQPSAKVIAEMDADSPASPPEQESGQRLHGGLPDWIAVTRRRAAKPRPDNGRPKPLATANVFKPLPVQETPGAKPHMAQLSSKTKADKESALAALKGVERLQFHTYTDKDDRAHISVVQGLYYSSAEELGSALLELGFKPTKVVAFKGDALVPRCQTFGHAERNCNRAARCVKCTGAHLTAECDRKEEAPVRCCNCGGERDGQTDNRARGGVAIFVKSNISHHSLPPVEHDICDIIAIRLESHRGQTPITIVNFYCPKQDSRITTAIAKALSLGNTVICSGDFNARHRHWDCNRANSNGSRLFNHFAGHEYNILIQQQSNPPPLQP